MSSFDSSKLILSKCLSIAVLLGAPWLSIAASADDHSPTKNKPKLILQVTVDQLRGDLPTRYYDRLGEGGFKYLWEKGVVYANAFHEHANTETIVGHTTLATGAQPAVHGMVGNVWHDRVTGRTTYNIEDPNYRLLSKGADVNAKTEIDPTQKAAKTEGRSPAAIMVTTFGDELKVNSNGKAKVFGVSIKDRGAVAMAGHTGKAFWFSKAKGEFVTSNYYYDQYPNWVTEWNAKKIPQGYGGKTWSLLHAQKTYLFGDSDDREWETDLAGFGRTFPHSYGPADGKYFTTLLTTSPAGDEITLDFAKTLLVAEKLGKDEITDYLSVSFSSTDYVGHLFGASSLESEDNILRLDRSLAKLFAAVDKQVGLQNTLIVLSADHGGPDTPGYLKAMNIPAGYIDPSSWSKEDAIVRLKKQFNIHGKIIEKYEHPYLYFSKSVIDNKEIDRQELEAAIVKELVALPGIAMAVSSKALQRGNLPETPLYQAVRNNFYAKRSGDVYVVFEPNWFINDFDGLVVASTHGSPWRYDSYVPMVFAGHGIESERVTRQVHTVDIATTLSAYLGIKPPSGAYGHVLGEVFD
ncbi:alkaline phosphatase family protein [Alkalimarinus sediminis]|uniref:Alkaline phosphatase family protein n=1 Tax=Alkalimarinus sediminis TaxID=1632866 RepID=A0A9E8HHX3_9ALTE|nr:alkaline phosphatase family protein [Alkalimarinus sediminis]UZW74635.1 alkaline phosphatase family protein [Alkalimarinus sediminis]